MAKAERKVEERISRREFLKRAVIVSAATFLSACGISTSPSAEDRGTSPDLTPTPEPTKGPSLTPTETKISTSTQTKTPEPTSTFTPEPTPTPTEIPLDIYHNFSGFEEGKWKMPEESEIPVISYEDITSGRLLEKELKLLSTGEVTPFTGNEAPLEVIYFKYSNGQALVNLKGEFYEIYEGLVDEPDKVPFRVTSLSFVDIEGTRLLVLGVAMHESDGRVVVLHYAFENYKDQFVINMVQAAVNRKADVLPWGVVHKPYYEGFGWYDYNKEPFMLEMYQDEEGKKERESLLQEWNDTGKAPEKLQKILLLGFIGPWDPYKQRDIKPKT